MHVQMRLPSFALKNRYQIESVVLGEGGEGVVVRALNTTSGGHVAVKFQTFASPRFDREFEFNREPHENLIHTIDHGFDPRLKEYGSTRNKPFTGHFIVLPYVVGPDLGRLCASHFSNSSHRGVALTVLRHCLLGLLRASKELKLIQHRDLKPSNLLLDFDARAVKISDFGTIQIPDSEITCYGSGVPATPEYAAPELLGPEEGLGDARSDIFSLGATLYAFLMGSAPVDGNSRLGSLAVKKLSPEEIRDEMESTGICDDVKSLLSRMLELNPENRPQTFDELLAEVNKLSNAESDAEFDEWLNQEQEIWITQHSTLNQQAPEQPRPLIHFLSILTVVIVAVFGGAFVVSLFEPDRGIRHSSYNPQLGNLACKFDGRLGDDYGMHWGLIHRVRFIPDSDFYVSSAKDTYLWPASRRAAPTKPPLPSNSQILAVDSKGESMLVGSHDVAGINVHETFTGKIVSVISEKILLTQNCIGSFSPSGNKVVFTNPDIEPLRLFLLQAESIVEIPVTSILKHIAFVNEELLLTASASELVVKDIVRNDVLASMGFSRILCCATCRDGSVTATSVETDAEQQIQVLKSFDLSPLCNPIPTKAEHICVTPVSNGLIRIAYSKSDRLTIANIISGVVTSSEIECSSPISDLDFSPDGDQLVVGIGNSTRLFDCKSLRWKSENRFHPDVIVGMDINDEIGQLVTVGADGIVIVWDLKNRKLRRRVSSSLKRVTDVEISPNGRLTGVSSYSYGTAFWDLSTESDAPVSKYPFGGLAIHFLSDSEFAVLDEDGIRRCRVVGGTSKPLFEGIDIPSLFPDEESKIADFAFLPSERQFIFVNQFGSLIVVNAKNGSLVNRQKGNFMEGIEWRKPMLCVGGERIVLMSEDVVLLYDKKLNPVGTHAIRFDNRSRCAASLSSDGNLLAVPYDGKVCLIDARTGAAIERFRIAASTGGGAEIRQLLFTSDSELLSANGNGTVSIIRLEQSEN